MKYNRGALLTGIVIVIGMVLISQVTQAEELVDIDIIIAIESGGNPHAYNPKCGGIGLMQITPIVLEEYNTFAEEGFVDVTLWDLQHIPDINLYVGTWYLTERIPQMLRTYNKPVSLRNVLVSWCCGIKYVAENLPLPKKCIRYLKKYERLLHTKQ